jgi:hypothetical protein
MSKLRTFKIDYQKTIDYTVYVGVDETLDPLKNEENRDKLISQIQEGRLTPYAENTGMWVDQFDVSIERDIFNEPDVVVTQDDLLPYDRYLARDLEIKDAEKMTVTSRLLF